MTSHVSLMMIALIGFCILLEVIREVSFKQAAHASSFQQTIRNPLIGLGICLWFIEFFAWTNVLSHLSLNVAFPLMSLSYVAILLAGHWVFKEKISKQHALGAFFITVGVILIGAFGA